MQKISKLISYLLTKHECVILPGLGAFVVYETKAVNSLKEGVFSPPARNLGFNPELNHNDGLLAGSLMKLSGISFEEASGQVKQYCQSLSNRLAEQKETSIPLVGTLRFSENQKIIFSPEKNLSSNAFFYGCDTFTMPLLAQNSLAEEIITSNSVELYPEIRKGQRQWRQWVRTSAAVAALFLTFATPMGIKHVSQQATMATAFENNRLRLDDVKIAHSLVIYQPVTETQEKEVEVLPEDTVLTTLPTAKKTNSLSVNPSRNYHIIVASFPSRKEADNELIRYQKLFGQVMVIDRDGRFRIVIRSFENKNNAESFLNSFRKKHPKHSDAWLFSSKAES